MLRQIILDTETTGLDPKAGHRVIEIGCIELVNRKFTGEQFHVYLNPDRDSDEGALEVHGLTTEFLSDKPRFGEIYEVFAKQIYQSDMYGFIEVEEYIFNKDKQLVVDPSSEKLKNEFSMVERSYIPINSIVRIDEVNETGEAKIKENKGQVSPFPLNIQPSNKKE